jgi:hypothetical protein
VEFHDPGIERGSAAGVSTPGRSRTEPADADSGLTASEWRRAGIAISGVTLVLIIAAGIHFLAPSKHDDSARPAATMTRALALTDAGSSVVDRAPELSEHVFEPQTRRAPSSRRVVPRPVRMSSREPMERRLADVHVEPAGADMPRVATIEYPEGTVQFVPARLATAAFVETPLPAAVADADRKLEPPAARGGRRDPVTAAFATAGSAVAGGIRSAGRAMRRVF